MFKNVSWSIEKMFLQKKKKNVFINVQSYKNKLLHGNKIQYFFFNICYFGLFGKNAKKHFYYEK